MSAIETGTEIPQADVATPVGPGARLRSARERAGLSLDQVAQALKLSPRQVKALEEEDFASLPGRTFARGFVRNYARLVNLDAEDLLAQLPEATQAPALASPSLHSTGRAIAEVPARRGGRPGSARWAMPLALVVCLVGAGGYEWYRGGGAWTSGGQAKLPAAAPAATIAQGTGATAQTELKNPLADAPSADATAADARESAAPVATASAATPANAAAASPIVAPAASSASAPAQTVVAAAQAARAPPADPAPVLLTYRGPSWTEIRDARGQVLLARLVAAGSEQQIRGVAPFDVTIGNARAVTLVYLGKPVDLTRHARQNVARLRLP